MQRFSRLFWVFILIPGLLFADTLILKNGQRIEGSIVGQGRNSLTIRTAQGTKTIPKSRIRRIVFGTRRKPVQKPKKPAQPAKPVRPAKPAQPPTPAVTR